MTKRAAIALLAITVFASPASARTVRLSMVSVPNACRLHHGLCITPKREKIGVLQTGLVELSVQTSQTLDTVEETDTCQNIAMFTLTLQYEFFAQYTIQSKGFTGACYAKFSGTANGQKVGPAKFKLIVVSN